MTAISFSPTSGPTGIPSAVPPPCARGCAAWERPHTSAPVPGRRTSSPPIWRDTWPRRAMSRRPWSPPTLPPGASSPGKGSGGWSGGSTWPSTTTPPRSFLPGRSAWTPGGPPAASSSTTSCGNWARSRRRWRSPSMWRFPPTPAASSTATPPLTPTGWRPP